MILNYIWIAFFLIAFVVAIIQYILGYTSVFSNIMNAVFSGAETGFTISIGLTGALSLWLGFMKIGEKGGAIQLMSKAVSPFFRKLFPEIPKDHPASGSMIMNFAANMLGLDNAATPLGLKAMDELQEINPKKDTASNAQIMFLVLNTSGLTLIPITILAYRATFIAKEGIDASPASVFIPILLATFCSSMFGLIVTSLLQKINLFNKTVLAYLGGASAIIIGFAYYIFSLPTEDVETMSSVIGNVILLLIIISFISLAAYKKINVYESFIEGAKEGFSIAIKIIPYLIAILVAIGAFRACGAMDFTLEGIASLLSWLGINADFVPALPTALMKPLSGSGARGMMLEAFETYGVDSFVGKLAATFQGSTETTFYVLAVYFGSVGIKKTRYALTAGLLADLAGIIAAIIIAYFFYK